MTNPYATCSVCPVSGWCKRKSGELPLPSDYHIDPECNIYILLSRALELSRIPREYINANARNYIVTDDNEHLIDDIVTTLKNVVTVVDKGKNVALLHPNKGTGKTYTACAIMNEYIYEGLKLKRFDYDKPMALYVKYGDWANEIRRAHQVHDPDAYREMYSRIDAMKEVPLLVIDDIGSGRITDVIRDLTYDVIDYRKEQMKSTIFTSNMTDEVMEREDKLGEMIVSRLMYNTTLLDLTGNDRRKDKG